MGMESAAALETVVCTFSSTYSMYDWIVEMDMMGCVHVVDDDDGGGVVDGSGVASSDLLGPACVYRLEPGRHFDSAPLPADERAPVEKATALQDEPMEDSV